MGIILTERGFMQESASGLFMSNGSKRYFPDRSWKGVHRGFVEDVHILREKERYGFVCGKMVSGRKADVKEALKNRFREIESNGSTIKSVNYQTMKVGGNDVIVLVYSLSTDAVVKEVLVGGEVFYSTVVSGNEDGYIDRADYYKNLSDKKAIQDIVNDGEDVEKSFGLLPKAILLESREAYQFGNDFPLDMGIVRMLGEMLAESYIVNYDDIKSVTVVGDYLFLVELNSGLGFACYCTNPGIYDLRFHLLNMEGKSIVQLRKELNGCVEGLRCEKSIYFSKDEIDEISRGYMVAYSTGLSDNGLVSVGAACFGDSYMLVMFGAKYINPKLFSNLDVSSRVLKSIEGFGAFTARMGKYVTKNSMAEFQAMAKRVRDFRGYAKTGSVLKK